MANQKSPQGESEPAGYVGRTVRAFVSYSSEDNILAGHIKDGLEKYGLETFLAHEDIDPAEEWQQVILENLESTDVFIPIVTSNFTLSKWTDQESGIAFTKEKVIVPISVDGNNPYGFIGKFQGMKVDSKSPIDCSEIIRAIIRRKPQLETQIIDSLIKSFAASRSWNSAKERASLLLTFEKMTQEQANEMFRATVQNTEIQGSFGARDVIPTLYKRHHDLVDKKITGQMTALGLISKPDEDDANF